MLIKKLVLFMVCLVILFGLSAISFTLFAEDSSGSDVPEGILQYFLSYGGTALLAGFLTQVVKNLTGIKGVAIQLISYLVGAVLVGFAWFVNIGIYAGLSGPELLAAIIAVGAVMNSGYDAIENLAKGNISGE